MIDRTMLHQIIDALPDEGLANIERVLQYEGLAPSTVGRLPEPTVKRIRQTLEQARTSDDWNSLHEKMRQGIQRTLRRLEVSGVAKAAHLPDGSHSSVQGFDIDGALIVLTFRHFKGYRLELAERISFSPEGHSLTYSLDVIGPDGGHSHHAAHFVTPGD